MAKESFFRESVTELAVMQAERLVGFLNETDSPAPSKEVWHAMQIFDLCQQLEDHLSTLQQSSPDMQAHNLFRAINTHLQEFSFLALVGPWRIHPFVSWRRAPARDTSRGLKRFDKQRHGEPLSAHFHLDMIRLILSMTEAGTVARIRKCICGAWFFAQTNKKRVCSNACRFQKFNSEHADYMRSYRKTKASLKNGNAKTKGR
jgi:hypothetical protein